MSGIMYTSEDEADTRVELCVRVCVWDVRAEFQINFFHTLRWNQTQRFSVHHIWWRKEKKAQQGWKVSDQEKEIIQTSGLVWIWQKYMKTASLKIVNLGSFREMLLSQVNLKLEHEFLKRQTNNILKYWLKTFHKNRKEMATFSLPHYILIYLMFNKIKKKNLCCHVW